MTPTPHPDQRAFDDVADACERCLEVSHGREIGMSFAAAIRALGRLGGEIDHDDSEDRSSLQRVDQLLLAHSTRYLPRRHAGRRIKPLEPATMVTNMVHDTRSPGSESRD
jgi:hypothetical protein